MSRALSAAIQVGVAEAVTNPLYLVEFGFDPVLRYCTGQPREWDGQSWLGGGCTVNSVSAQAARLTLRNDDNSLSALILGNRLVDITCRIWQWYNDDALPVFVGRLDEAPTIGAQVVLTAKEHSGAAKYPDKRIDGSVCSRILPSGTVINWGNNTVTLESGR